MATHFKGPLVINSGTPITKIVKGTFTMDAADLATVTAADESVTVSGATVGDTVIVNCPATALTAGMLVCQAWVSATDTIKVRLYNASGGSINLASLTFTYCLIRS
jgi:hypothetical protein